MEHECLLLRIRVMLISDTNAPRIAGTSIAEDQSHGVLNLLQRTRYLVDRGHSIDHHRREGYQSVKRNIRKDEMTDASANFRIYSRALERKQLPEDPKLRADIEHVMEHGYVIIPDCFTKAEAKEARDEIVRLLGHQPLGGRNNFEGINTNRIYSLLNKSRVFDKFTILPQVLALNDYFLDPGYLLTALHTISINPGEKAQALHHDDGYIQFPRPRLPFGSAIMVAFDEYTVENGENARLPVMRG